MRSWDSETHTSQGARPLDWRSQRMELLLEAMEKGDKDWEKSIEYLENKVNANENDFDSRNALQFLKGYYGYHQFMKDHP